MIHLNPVTAKDELFKLLTDRFKVYLVANNIACDIRYQGKLRKDVPSVCWVRISMQQVISPLKAYINNQDGADNQIFETSGLIFAQVNVAMSSLDGFRLGDLLATELKAILRSAETPSGMWLRNARFNELPSDGEFYKWNVVAEYEYDEQS
jgi:hypothetical protein